MHPGMMNVGGGTDKKLELKGESFKEGMIENCDLNLLLYSSTVKTLSNGTAPSKKSVLFLEYRYATAVLLEMPQHNCGEVKSNRDLSKTLLPFFLYILTESLDLFAKCRENPLRTLTYHLEG